MMTSIPLMVLAGAVMAVIISKMASRGQTAYAKAANVVEQTIGSIRTVSHHTQLSTQLRFSITMLVCLLILLSV